MLAGYAGIGKPAARDEVHGNRELAFAGIKVDALYVPRGLDSQSGFKQLVRHGSFRLAWLLAALCRQHPLASLYTPRASRVRCAGLTPALDPPDHPLRIQKRPFSALLNLEWV